MSWTFICCGLSRSGSSTTTHRPTMAPSRLPRQPMASWTRAMTQILNLMTQILNLMSSSGLAACRGMAGGLCWDGTWLSFFQHHSRL